MHLSNGIICPVTGIPMLVLAAGTAVHAYKKAKTEFSKDKILPALGLSAFVFALQMINFSIPLMGSSGHIIGGLLLAALLGPNVAFLAMSAILLTQALFFNDGGLLALGCNIFNMGFLACFLAYPFIFKPLKNKPFLGAFLASIVALQLGSIAAVFEGILSGTVSISALANFTALMQAIHLPIGIVEGFICAIVVYLSKRFDDKKLSYCFMGVSLLLAGVISKYASNKPDGLEWSLLNISNDVIENTQGVLYNLSASIQAKTSILTEHSILGVFAIICIMYLICSMLVKTVKLDAK